MILPVTAILTPQFRTFWQEKTMASVTLEHVYKRFGDATIIADLNIEVADKEFLVLVGPSGCGKTTILRMIAGLEKVSEGIIRIGDRIVNDVPPGDRNIAMVFELDALYPHFTVDNNIAFSLKIRNMPTEKVIKKVKEVATTLRLPNLLNRMPATLSPGQRRQAAIGRAIVREPALFLMDEPLSNLDAKLRSSNRAEIKKLHRQLGTTFIYVTHDQVEAMSLGDRIAVLDDGVLQQVDTPRVLYNQPANIFVAGFIGSPSMNFLNATLVDEKGTLYVDTGAFRVAVPPYQRLNAFEAYVDEKVIFGFRPEHIHAPGFAPHHILAEPFKAQIGMVELLGRELQLHLKVGDGEFIARVDPRMDVYVGQDVDLLIDMERIHLFDDNTGVAIR